MTRGPSIPEPRRDVGHRRVGVFGGTFDPPHIGHLVAAADARYALGLDVVLLVVANQPWQKVGSRQITPAPVRLAMVEAAVAGIEGLEASDLELRRGGDSYTADTLSDLRAAEPDAELFLVLGADAAAGFGTWERHEEVAAAARLVVVDRPGSPTVLDDPYDWLRIDTPELEVSSTEVRRRVSVGAPVQLLTPPGVVTVIRDHGLYRGGR